jgi:transcriptional regulator with XRE-family HTH domain
MPRSRRWILVGQECARLFALGLRPAQVAQRVGVDVSTVRRWLRGGLLRRPAVKHRIAKAGGSAKGWARNVRASFLLDSTDTELVGLGEIALLIARDPRTPAAVRLNAMARFAAITRQLALVTRTPIDADPPSPHSAPAPPQPERPQPRARPTDPRTMLVN